MKYKQVTLVAGRIAYFRPSTLEFIEHLKTRAANAQVKNYVEKNILKFIRNTVPARRLEYLPEGKYPKWLTESFKAGQPVYDVVLDTNMKFSIRRWVDYLNTLPEDKQLNRLPIEKLDQLTRKWISKWSHASPAQLRRMTLQDEITYRYSSLIHKYSDGFYWVQIHEAGLEREGTLMNHCVGQYINKLDVHNIYSLRDPDNIPHVTLDVGYLVNPRNNDEDCYLLMQAYGNSNSLVKPMYFPYVKDFLESQYVRVDLVWHTVLDPYKLAFVNGKLINIHSVPENSELWDVKFPPGEAVNLPNGLTVRGRLDLSETLVKSLPNNLTVETLILDDTQVTEIPSSTKITEVLYAHNSHLHKIPNLDHITGISISNTKIVLPQYIKASTVELVKCKIVNTHCEIDAGDVNLSNSHITNLPHIKARNLNLTGCKGITEIPPNVHVRNTLTIVNTDIKQVSEEIEAETIITDNRDLQFTGKSKIQYKTLHEVNTDYNAKLRKLCIDAMVEPSYRFDPFFEDKKVFNMLWYARSYLKHKRLYLMTQ